MILKLYSQNPSEKELLRISKVLADGGVIAFPTDGFYAYGCAIDNRKGFDRIRELKNGKKGNYSIMCSEISQISAFAKVDNSTFRLLKRYLPGPYTFILEALSKVPENVMGKRKTVGVRISANEITREIVDTFGMPLITATIDPPDEDIEYSTDPELIHEHWEDKIDLVVDGGYGVAEPTTVVDLTGEEPEIIRQGSGEF